MSEFTTIKEALKKQRKTSAKSTPKPANLFTLSIFFEFFLLIDMLVFDSFSKLFNKPLTKFLYCTYDTVIIIKMMG
jgi:hypothetical protein